MAGLSLTPRILGRIELYRLRGSRQMTAVKSHSRSFSNSKSKPPSLPPSPFPAQDRHVDSPRRWRRSMRKSIGNAPELTPTRHGRELVMQQVPEVVPVALERFVALEHFPLRG
jgi:hypothetical protein